MYKCINILIPKITMYYQSKAYKSKPKMSIGLIDFFDFRVSYTYIVRLKVRTAKRLLYLPIRIMNTVDKMQVNVYKNRVWICQY